MRHLNIALVTLEVTCVLIAVTGVGHQCYCHWRDQNCSATVQSDTRIGRKVWRKRTGLRHRPCHRATGQEGISGRVSAGGLTRACVEGVSVGATLCSDLFPAPRASSSQRLCRAAY
jgi:hypothetical protein